MSEWSTQRVRVAVTLVEGVALEGDVHVLGRVAHHEGVETPLEFLNRAEPFFALSLVGGDTAFVPKSQVALVACELQVPIAADPERLSAARRVDLEVVLTGGAALRGWASVELPPGRGRTLDYVNGPERFFTLWTEDAARYVNRTNVRFIRPLD